MTIITAVNPWEDALCEQFAMTVALIPFLITMSITAQFQLDAL